MLVFGSSHLIPVIRIHLDPGARIPPPDPSLCVGENGRLISWTAGRAECLRLARS